MILLFIQLFLGHLLKMTGLIRKYGKKQTLHLELLSVLTKLKQHMNQLSKILPKKIVSGSLGSISGSSKRCAGCLWTNGMPARLMWILIHLEEEFAMVVWIFLLQLTSQLLYWFFHHLMKKINMLSFPSF